MNIEELINTEEKDAPDSGRESQGSSTQRDLLPSKRET